MRTTANIAGIKPVITGALTLSNSNTINLINSDFAVGSFAIKDGTSSNDEFAVGGAVIKTCEFVLLNDSHKFDNLDWTNSKVSITFNYTNPVLTLDMGAYHVMSHKETGNRIKVESGDSMKVLDEHLFYEVNEASTTILNTADTIVSGIATHFGFTYTGLRQPSLSIVDWTDDMTVREVLSAVAQCMGQYVYIDENDVITFEWYDTSTVYDVGTSFSHDLRTADITITGVKVIANDGKTTQTRGTDDYMLTISENSCIDTRNVSSVADNIYAAVNGITFRPGTVSIVSNPAIEAGDMLRVTTNRGTVNILATSMAYKPTLKQSVTADADPEDGDLRVTKAQRMSGMIQVETEKEISKQLADSNSKLSKAIAQGGGGGSSWDGKIGGQNNKYGTIKQYSNSVIDTQLGTWDNTGITLKNGPIFKLLNGTLEAIKLAITGFFCNVAAKFGASITSSGTTTTVNVAEINTNGVKHQNSNRRHPIWAGYGDLFNGICMDVTKYSGNNGGICNTYIGEDCISIEDKCYSDSDGGDGHHFAEADGGSYQRLMRLRHVDASGGIEFDDGSGTWILSIDENGNLTTRRVDWS